jgi:hypothetical protein
MKTYPTGDGHTLAWNDDMAWPLTPCCAASGKGGEYGIVCRACYEPVAMEYGMGEVVKTEEELRTWADTWWGGLIEQPQTEEQWHVWYVVSVRPDPRFATKNKWTLKVRRQMAGRDGVHWIADLYWEDKWMAEVEDQGTGGGAWPYFADPLSRRVYETDLTRAYPDDESMRSESFIAWLDMKNGA